VIKLYQELTAENVAPTLGTQNQAVELILADPELRRAVAEWALTTNTDEASTAPPRRLPQDELYRGVCAYLRRSWRQDHGAHLTAAGRDTVRRPA
jgi:hypothetical protein